MGSLHRITVRRAYDAPERGDGTRVLVDRIWPRGLRKDDVDFDEWLKEVAPSTELRTWYGHVPERFDEFATRYRAELKEPERADALAHLCALARHGNLTLLTASKAADISQAAVLAEVVREVVAD